MERIFIFYHVYAYNDWDTIMCEQLNELLRSGLYLQCEKLYVYMTRDYYDNKSEDRLRAILSSFGNCHIKISTDNCYEFPTLEWARSLSKSERVPFKGLYLHTKGSSYDKNRHDKEKSDIWRRMMNYFNITMWKSNVEKLKEHDLSGWMKYDGNIDVDTYWKTYSKQANIDFWRSHTAYYAGNFFWFDSNYFKTLPELSDIEKMTRHNAEFYAFRNNPKAFDWNEGCIKIF